MICRLFFVVKGYELQPFLLAIQLTENVDFRVVERQSRYIHTSFPSEIWERTFVQGRFIFVF